MLKFLMGPKKYLLCIFIVMQVFTLVFIKTGLHRQDYFGIYSKIRNVWTRQRNNTSEVDQAEVSWLNSQAKNITNRSKDFPTLQPTDSFGNMILKPTIHHKKGQIFLLVLVTTIPKSVKTRELIRNTWAKANLPLQGGFNSSYATNFTYYVVFMLGITGDREQDKALEDEAEKYGDILRGSYRESYRNIITKVWYAFEWAQQYHPKYILKADDDIYVRIPRLAKWLLEGNAPPRLYSGYVHYRAYISRDPKSDHYVNISEYNGQVFPNYCAGPCYTFSGELLDEFLKLSKSVTKFKVEDAYLGLVAQKAGVKPYDIGGKLFVWDRTLSHTVQKWSDQQLSKVICLGDSLTPEIIAYIHKRYVKIDGSSYQRSREL